MRVTHPHGPPEVLMRLRVMCFTAATVLLASFTTAQSAPARGPQPTGALRVFLDCETMGCDTDFFVTEIPYVDFIRDRADAHVHLLVTSLGTGAGGSEYTVNFIGLGRFANHADTVVSSLPPNSTEDARRKELARVFKLGLVHYLSRTSAVAHLRVTYDAPSAAAGKLATGTSDPWNAWVYRIGGNTSFGGESESHRASYSASLSARRITENLKVSLAASGSYRESSFSFADGSSSTFALRSYDGSARLVKSYGQHWSGGLNAGLGAEDFSNQKLSASAAASAEYNFFPWSQATRNQFVAIYAVGMKHFRYKEETIYFETTETRPHHQVVLAATSRQPWGSFDLQASAFKYLHDGSKYNAGVFGNVDLRLARGLSLSLFSSFSQVHDQLFIAGSGLSRDEVLTQQRARATSYQYSGFVSLSYTFGSLFNNVVNPRLDNLGGGGRTFFFF